MKLGDLSLYPQGTTHFHKITSMPCWQVLTTKKFMSRRFSDEFLHLLNTNPNVLERLSNWIVLFCFGIVIGVDIRERIQIIIGEKRTGIATN